MVRIACMKDVSKWEIIFSALKITLSADLLSLGMLDLDRKCRQREHTEWYMYNWNGLWSMHGMDYKRKAIYVYHIFVLI